ncbi:Response regulator receiver domain-containing protein [Duganella sp. CF458]|uniref:response regulator n=1 Tax=Duganella sp. CF458 TaxID=1884368 RepID=UPI0008EA6185|nr:response regulator [Duganella sp. CF458]SFF51416.1 Response regulator receiver domain-containing protein [Duganella sp. CF458]
MSARILIIEDNQANMDLMTYLLQAFGHRPLCATDGETGVAMAISEKPDLILSDLHLPKLDGLGVVARLRADPATRAIPVLAASALPVTDGCAALRRAGFSGCLPKSLEPDVLIPALESFLPTHLRSASAHPVPTAAASPPSAAAAPAATAARARVLLLDAAPENAGLVAAILAHSGYTVSTASNPMDTGALMDGHTYDLVLCELGVLEEGRLSFLRDALEMAPGLPVLVIRPDDEDNLGNLGTGRISGALSHPLDPQQLVAAIDGLLGRAAR